MCVLYFLTAIYLIVIDSIYLSFQGKLFDSAISQIQKSPMKINYTGAILSYFFTVTGLYYFIIRQKKSILEAFLLGIFVYGVYETTNYALFHKWKPEIVIIDTLWGGVLFALTTYLVNLTSKKIRT